MLKSYQLLIMLIASFCHAQQHEYDIRILSGASAPLDFLAEQWCSAFRDYPYLFDGTKEKEIGYMQWLSEQKDNMFIVAYYNDLPIGFMNGVALTSFDEHLMDWLDEKDKNSIQRFRDAGLNPEDFFYISEAIIIPEHRGHGLIKKLYETLEKQILNRGYSSLCFTTEFPREHPLKPKDYKELDAMWLRSGCVQTHITVPFVWNTIQTDGSSRDEEHILVYWIKKLK